MRISTFRILVLLGLLFSGNTAAQVPIDHEKAARDYKQYCALCHGDDRRGYANDYAPSLVSETLYAMGTIVPSMAVRYGRVGTVMGPYLDEVGGPLTTNEINNLVNWLTVESGNELKGPDRSFLDPVVGDVELGESLYAENCAGCHGDEGQGHGPEGPGTALSNPTMLATTPDGFLKMTVVRGRADTPMVGFEGRLSEHEINSVVAFIRTRASGWSAEEMQVSEVPSLEDAVLNPEGEAPDFELQDGLFVSAKDLNAALEAKNKMIVLDTRVPYFWGMAHIVGSLPVPYYSSREELVDALPNDGTWIVAYCECPRAAAESLVARLRDLGFSNTAVLWEGYAGWAALGYPVAAGNAAALVQANEAGGD